MIHSFLIFVLIVCLLSACTPKLQEPGPAPAPQDPRIEAGSIIASDGTRLPMRIWEADTPRGVIVALHGMNDYGNAFHMAGPWWAREAGLAVYAYDQRGFGETNQRGLWPGTGRLVDDVATAVDLVRARHPGLPVYLVGHSMGAAVAMVAVAENAVQPDGLVLVAPAVWGWSALPFTHRAALWLAAHVTPGKQLTGGRVKIQPSDNLPMLRAQGADPLVIKGTRIDAVYGLVGLMDQAYDRAGAVPGPVLLLHGDRDEIIPRAAVETVRDGLCRRKAGPPQVVFYPHGYHMLLRDLQAERVWRDIADWVRDPASHSDRAPCAEGAAKTALGSP